MAFQHVIIPQEHDKLTMLLEKAIIEHVKSGYEKVFPCSPIHSIKNRDQNTVKELRYIPSAYLVVKRSTL